ncbi:hypothetical protein TELCIR_04432 [Teladorsagia circumcincta]|uniref:UDP-N-acetylglucosamine pyrophosphorylase n=1 Tax=Teladorsagia circumcincta TaxID=45464 RepID=A0A2G9UTL8_TELCI|nr:hypothetical protein TELCIR_04432 [Teladorsagia circumcincta]
MSYEELLERVGTQKHLLHFWNELSDDEKKSLAKQAISRGEVAAIVLAGGQASRLGSSAPKGTIPLGLGVAPCDSLLGIQACKIALLEKLAKEEFPEAKETAKIPWLVMTS